MIRELDRRAVSVGGIPGSVLMENAGRAVVGYVHGQFGPVAGCSVYVACGTGNNGGDGFVAARHLHLAGAHVTVSITGDPSRIQGDALTHYNLMIGAGITAVAAGPSNGQIKIDALLGTGVTGAPRAEVAASIEALNACDGPTVAVDIPSGIDADTGEAPGAAVRARATVTFGYPKLGLYLREGANASGDIIVDPIGFPWESLSVQTPYAWLRSGEMRRVLPPRPRDGHKGTFGHVLVVGGSVGMSGAPIMTARAAARTGSGLVSAAVPASIQPLVAAGMDELMTIPLPDTDGALTEQSARRVQEFAAKCNAVCLGPGLRNTPATHALVAKLLSDLMVPIVLDADGLNALADQPDMLSARTATTVLTPHPGECARLLSISTADVEADRIAAVRETARKYRAVVVLKGARTLICDSRGNGEAPIGINTTGNVGMATGGSGDTLTGIIGSLIGQGCDPWDAACLGVYVHGCAGDLAAARKHTRGLMAGDISEEVPAALRELEESA